MGKVNDDVWQKQTEIDWEQRKYEIAKDALTALLSNPTRVYASHSKVAVDYADALIEEYGHWDGTRCLILLAHGAGGEELSEERKAQTFFHELTHAALDAIGEDELNGNEQFIDAFSNVLYQALKTME